MNNNILDKIKNKLIVSCQGYDTRTFNTAEDMLSMANAAALGGCVGFRLNSIEHVKLVRENFPNHIIIGILKKEYENSNVYITPDLESALELKKAGANIIALDATNRKNYKGKYGWETIKEIKEVDSSIVIMADCSTFEEAKLAVENGADIVSTTMSGYTDYSTPISKNNDGPDFDLIKKINKSLDTFIICEGRIWTREDALKCFNLGVDSIVVGTAITNPKQITERFVKYLKENNVWQ